MIFNVYTMACMCVRTTYLNFMCVCWDKKYRLCGLNIYIVIITYLEFIQSEICMCLRMDMAAWICRDNTHVKCNLLSVFVGNLFQIDSLIWFKLNAILCWCWWVQWWFYIRDTLTENVRLNTNEVKYFKINMWKLF